MGKEIKVHQGTRSYVVVDVDWSHSGRIGIPEIPHSPSTGPFILEWWLLGPAANYPEKDEFQQLGRNEQSHST